MCVYSFSHIVNYIPMISSDISPKIISQMNTGPRGDDMLLAASYLNTQLSRVVRKLVQVQQ